ncbi:M23 family metallopeptidase [Elusimicrobiota bacterium]
MVTASGFFFAVKHVEFSAKAAQYQLAKAKLKVLIKDIEEMRDIVEGVALLEGDLKLLLSKDVPTLDGFKAKEAVSHDTLTEIMMGRLSEKSLRELREKSRETTALASNILANASALYVNDFNTYAMERSLPTAWPSVGVITSGYGLRQNPFHPESLHPGQIHHGIDLANLEGTPVRAAADGIVRRAKWTKGYGRTIVLDHGFGYSTLYGHNAKINVEAGEFVDRGNIIGHMGTTGKSTGSHLHFEVWQHGRPINPFRFVKFNDLKNLREAYAQIPLTIQGSVEDVLNLGIGGP